MKIYIRENLRDIPIFKHMYDLVKAYGDKYGNLEEIDPMADYRYFLKNDNVLRFLDYVFLRDEEEGRDNKITYLASIFYLTKGTYKVLDYIIGYNLLREPVQISYSARNISITINKLYPGFDRDLFCEYLEKFLHSLLYFESLTINIEEASEGVIDNTSSSLNHGQIFYQYYEVKEEDENTL